MKYLTTRATDGKEAELEFVSKHRSQRNVFTVGQRMRDGSTLMNYHLISVTQSKS